MTEPVELQAWRLVKQYEPGIQLRSMSDEELRAWTAMLKHLLKERRRMQRQRMWRLIRQHPELAWRKMQPYAPLLRLPVYVGLFVLALMAAFWVTTVGIWAGAELLKIMLHTLIPW